MCVLSHFSSASIVNVAHLHIEIEVPVHTLRLPSPQFPGWLSDSVYLVGKMVALASWSVQPNFTTAQMLVPKREQFIHISDNVRSSDTIIIKGSSERLNRWDVSLTVEISTKTSGSPIGRGSFIHSIAALTLDGGIREERTSSGATTHQEAPSNFNSHHSQPPPPPSTTSTFNFPEFNSPTFPTHPDAQLIRNILPPPSPSPSYSSFNPTHHSTPLPAHPDLERYRSVRRGSRLRFDPLRRN